MKTFINHKDTNPDNNDADNLEWCTQKENMNYPATVAKFGRRVAQYTKKGKLIQVFSSVKAAAVAIGINRRTLHKRIQDGIPGKTLADWKWKFLDPPVPKRT